MSFLAALSPAVSARLAVPSIEFAFAVYALASLVLVVRYAVRAAPLIGGPQAPPPLQFSPAASGLFWACLLALFGVASVPWMILPFVFLIALPFALDRTLREQFGLSRYPLPRVLAGGIVVCGAVVALELPLTWAMDRTFEIFHVRHPEQVSVETFRQLVRPLEVVVFLFQAVVLSPLIEELLFRGFLFGGLKRYVSTSWALVISAGIFALVHFNLNAALPLWIFGLVLGLVYEHTGSIVLVYAIHACWNLVTAVSLLLERGGSG